jgi:hypothetical protein
MGSEPRAIAITDRTSFRQFLKALAGEIEQESKHRISNKAVAELLKPGHKSRTRIEDYADIDPKQLEETVKPLLRLAVEQKERRHKRHKDGNYVRNVDISRARKVADCHYLWYC